MQVDYRPQQLLRLYFESDGLINIRITVNGEPKVIQCRTEMAFSQPIDLAVANTVSIENLTNGIACNVTKVCLNYLDLTKIIYQYANTYTKEDMTKIGEFVSDLYSPDICIITTEAKDNIYQKMLPFFKEGSVTFHTP